MVELNSKNYSVWKTLIEDMLYIKDLYVDLSVYPHVDKKLMCKACGRSWQIYTRGGMCKIELL